MSDGALARRGHARGQPRPARAPRSAALRHAHAGRAAAADRARRAARSACGALLPDQLTRAHSSSTCTRLRGEADAILLNPGAWTHYAWAIRDALEIAALPGARDPPLRHRAARAVAARLGDRRPVLRDRLRARPGRLSRGAGARCARSSTGGAREPPPARVASGRAPGAASGSRELAELELDALLVDAPVDVRYLTGFTGSNGLRARGRAGAALGRPLPDRLPLRDPVRGTGRRRVRARDRQRRAARGAGRGAAAAGGRLGFDEAHAERQGATAGSRELLGSGGSWCRAAARWQRLRAVKDEGEIARIRAAAQLADEALTRRCSKGVSWGAPSARSRSSWSCACAASARRRRASPRSSRPARTARCRTPSPRDATIPPTCS